MPLLNKNPFVPQEPPPDLSDSEEVFFCRLTREIFRDYEQFCDRIILCNSLVWSCSLTGRSHLTYQEAAASEEKVKRLLKRFPMELRIPVLYLASLCERKSLVELAEDVFTFVKDRFFLRETVYISQPGKDKMELIECHVLAVNPPSKEEIESYEQKHHKNGERFHWIPASLYTYDLVRMDNGEDLKVSGDQISRKKASYTKDKNRLYIKQFVHLDNGIWKLKESSNSKYGISKVKFDQIFCGEAPDMTIRKREGSDKKKGKRQETLNKYFKSTDKKIGLSPRKSPKKSGDILDRRAPGMKRKRRTKKEMEEAMKRGTIGTKAHSEAKRKMREENKEKKKNLAEFYKEWNMKREDLECEDLKDLPTPVQVTSRLPNTLVGEAIMLMEFLHSFRSLLPVKDFFPHGITFDLVERALVEKEIAGPLADILQLLLTSIFDLQEQEFEEIKETDVKITPGLIFTRGGPDIIKVVKAATVSDALAKKNHTVPLNQLSVDYTTISEVLRLHILSSGAIPGKSKVAKWRYQTRGGYCNNDDPAVYFKLRKPQLLEKLGLQNIFEFSPEEKIAVLNCLVEQIITYSSFRDIMEEGCEKARQTRVELRSVRAAEVKKEKEEALRLKAEKKNGITLPTPAAPTASPEEKKHKDNRELRSLNCDRRGEIIPDLLADIREALAGAQLSPLGTDSAHRRYWIFCSVPGLFVEEGEENPGPCIPNGTPSFSCPSNGSEEDNLSYIRRLFEESSKDKENLPGRGPPPGQPSPNKRHMLSEKNGSPTNSPQNGQKNDMKGRSGLVCTGSNDTCPVHGPDRPKSWSFFSEPTQVDQLIEGLNRRGVRERKLRQALSQEKSTIVERLNSCPADKFNVLLSSGSKVFTEMQNKSMKTYDQASYLGYPKDTPLESILEANLRDLILETEEKIFLGVVGGLKVKNRESWREAIKNGGYDQQCKKLNWGAKGSDDTVEDGAEIKDEPMDDEIKKEELDEESRASTPSLDEANPSSAWPGIQSVPQRPVVLDLASAILQLAQGIEYKYLKRPLGLDPKEREEKKICLIEPKFPTVCMGRWEEGLMSSTNIPQLFLYLTTLDNSVSWEKSALHASCRICRRKKDPESMLLCDTCNKGYHLYCLKPKLNKVPPGDWHCPKCQPKEKHISPKKKRRLFSENSDGEDNTEENDCKSCGEAGAELGCGTCDTWLHLDCVNPPMRRVPKSKWFCHDCRNANSQQTPTTSRKSGAAEVKVEVKEEPAEEMEVEVEEPKPARQPAKSRSSARGGEESSRRKESRERNSTPASRPRMNGHVNGIQKHNHSEEEQGEERSSRRKCSKAATAKISQFAKQLRSSNWDGDSESGDEESTPTTSSRPKRDRRSVRRSDGLKSRDLPLDNAALQEILDVIMHDPDAPPFLRPVTKSEAPDYHEIIMKPMDFGTIKHKLNMLFYKKNQDLIQDAELLFSNCFQYNERGSEVFRAGMKLRKLFVELCKQHNLPIKENLGEGFTDDDSESVPKRIKTED